MLWMPGDVISSVWPSGSALATTSAPILPPAPGRFSTMTGWPRVLASSSPTARASTSTSPPAGNGAIMRMGFVGQVCAPAADANAAPRIRNAANVRGNRRMTPSACGRLRAGHGRVHARRRRAHVHAFARRFSHESYHQMALELDKLRLFRLPKCHAGCFVSSSTFDARPDFSAPVFFMLFVQPDPPHRAFPTSPVFELTEE